MDEPANEWLGGNRLPERHQMPLAIRLRWRGTDADDAVEVPILVFARHVYWDLLEWRRHKLPPEERYGFSNPVRERPRAEELPHELEVEITPSSS